MASRPGRGDSSPFPTAVAVTELPRLGEGGRSGGVCESVRLWQCAAALAMISSCLSWSQSSRLG